jgi:hypothetical protein
MTKPKTPREHTELTLDEHQFDILEHAYTEFYNKLAASTPFCARHPDVTDIRLKLQKARTEAGWYDE